MVDETSRAGGPEPQPAPESRRFGAVGEHVAGILEAAEQAAERIRQEARREAAELERLAVVEADRLKDELTREAREIRGEAEEYARDMRLAVESYATQHRRQAEQEARELIAEAERQSAGSREAAEQMVRQVEADVRNRQDKLRAEVRMLEGRKRDAIERLREIAALVQDVIPTGERQKSLVRDLKPERQPASSDS